MNPLHDERSPLPEAAQPGLTVAGRGSFSYSLVSMSSELSVMFDPLCVAAAAVGTSALLARSAAASGAVFSPSDGVAAAAGVAAVLAAFILYDPRFGALAVQGRIGALLRGYAVRFSVLSAVLLGLGAVSGTLSNVPPVALVIWVAASLTSTVLARILAARLLLLLQRQGAFTEVVAVVGTGASAERAVQALQQPSASTIELLGVFDDTLEPPFDAARPGRNLSHLIALGQARKIDWILVALPVEAEPRLSAILLRLKALSVPIGLCPHDLGAELPQGIDARVGDAVTVTVLAGKPERHWDVMTEAGETLVPRWIVTLVLLVLAGLDTAVRQTAAWLRQLAPPAAARRTLTFDAYDLPSFTGVAARFGHKTYGFVVTPNADHVIRLDEEPSFRALYAAADYVLLDSRFLSKLLRLIGGPRLPVCTGSDLTARLLCDVVVPNDPLVLIGCSDRQARLLAERYGLENLAHFNPPMGFIHDPAEVEACLRFVEAHSPFRFCLLAVGAPQQEMVAQLLKARGTARGLALCIGASVNFLTGDERRAPRWMQRSGTEWLFRLLQDPRRMARRYLLRGPRVFGVLRGADIVLRPSPAEPVQRKDQRGSSLP